MVYCSGFTLGVFDIGGAGLCIITEYAITYWQLMFLPMITCCAKKMCQGKKKLVIPTMKPPLYHHDVSIPQLTWNYQRKMLMGKTYVYLSISIYLSIYLSI